MVLIVGYGDHLVIGGHLIAHIQIGIGIHMHIGITPHADKGIAPSPRNGGDLRGQNGIDLAPFGKAEIKTVMEVVAQHIALDAVFAKGAVHPMILIKGEGRPGIALPANGPVVNGNNQKKSIKKRFHRRTSLTACFSSRPTHKRLSL